MGGSGASSDNTSPAEKVDLNWAISTTGHISRSAPAATSDQDTSPEAHLEPDAAQALVSAAIDVSGDIHGVEDGDLIRAREISFQVARNRGFSREDAEDIAQTVAEKLLYQSVVPDNVEAWATKVAKNAVTDVDRRRKRTNTNDDWVRREVALDGEVDIDGAMAVGQFIRRQRATSAQGMQRRAGLEIEALVRQRLNDREMSVVLLLAENRSHDEIAQRLGYKNAATVKTTVKRIREKVVDLADQLVEFMNHPRVY